VRKGIEIQEAVEVLGEVENHSDVAALPGETGSPTTREDRRFELPTYGHGGDDIIHVARDDDADGNLSVV
jgi:hypothetical protein